MSGWQFPWVVREHRRGFWGAGHILCLALEGMCSLCSSSLNGSSLFSAVNVSHGSHGKIPCVCPNLEGSPPKTYHFGPHAQRTSPPPHLLLSLSFQCNELLLVCSTPLSEGCRSPGAGTTRTAFVLALRPLGQKTRLAPFLECDKEGGLIAPEKGKKQNTKERVK